MSSNKNLIFDIGGTLYDGKICILNGLRSINNKFLGNLVPEERLFSIYKNIYTKYPIKHGDIVLGEIDHFDKFSKELGYRANLTQLFETYKQTAIDNMYLFKNVKTTLEKLCNSGYSLYILSNGRTFNQNFKLNFWGINELFKTIYISEEMDMTKPDEKVFQYILSKEDLNPKNCIMIGDSILEDIEPASNLGIKGLLFTSNPPFHRLCFSDYKSLPGMIENLWN